MELEATILNAIKKIDESLLQSTRIENEDESTTIVRVSGSVGGTVPYDAVALRTKLQKAVKRIELQVHRAVILIYDASDAMTRLEELLSSMVAFELGIPKCEVAVVFVSRQAVVCNVDVGEYVPPGDLTGVLRQLSATISRALRKSELRLARAYIRARGLEWPTDLHIMQRIKAMQPARVLHVVDGLKSAGYYADDRLVRSAFDRFRHKGLVVVDEDRAASLTMIGLQSLPARPDRQNTDVARALALGRRKW